MKKLLVLLGLCPTLAFAAAATYTNPDNMSAQIVCASGTCDAPTLESQGVSLGATRGFVVTVSADATKTLSGAGAIDCYVWDATFGRWSFLQDLGLTVTKASVRDVTLTGVFTASPRGKIACVPTGVTVSAGGVTLYITAGS